MKLALPKAVLFVTVKMMSMLHILSKLFSICGFGRVEIMAVPQPLITSAAVIVPARTSAIVPHEIASTAKIILPDLLNLLFIVTPPETIDQHLGSRD